MKNWTINSKKFLNEEQLMLVKHYCDTAPKADREAILGLLFTGLRAQEAITLQVADYVPGAINVVNGKGGKDRTILLTDDGNAFFKALVGPRTSGNMFLSSVATPWSKRGLQRVIERMREKLNMEFTTHSMRHTYCTLLIKSGETLPTIRSNMGHSSIAVTDVYSHACSKLKTRKLL